MHDSRPHYTAVTTSAHNNHNHLMIFVLDRKLKTLIRHNKMSDLHFCFTVARALHYCSPSFSFARLIRFKPIIITIVWKMTTRKQSGQTDPNKRKHKTKLFHFTNDVWYRCCCFRKWNRITLMCFSFFVWSVGFF